MRIFHSVSTLGFLAPFSIIARWLRNQAYRIKSQAIPSFVGKLMLENKLTGFHYQRPPLFAGYAAA